MICFMERDVQRVSGFLCGVCWTAICKPPVRRGFYGYDEPRPSEREPDPFVGQRSQKSGGGKVLLCPGCQGKVQSSPAFRIRHGLIKGGQRLSEPACVDFREGLLTRFAERDGCTEVQFGDELSAKLAVQEGPSPEVVTVDLESQPEIGEEVVVVGGLAETVTTESSVATAEPVNV